VREFGIEPWRPEVPAVLGEIQDGGRAAQAGLERGDEVLAVDGESVSHWFDLVERIRDKPDTELTFLIRRQGSEQEIKVTPERHEDEGGEAIGLVGAGVEKISWPEHMQRESRFGPIEALPEAVGQFWNDTRVTVNAVGKMVTGLLSVQNISGPITIARVAETTVSSGFEDFMRFLAYLSISLGIINLLPIPILDGGHIIFYALEWLRGKPLSERAQGLWLRIGLALIATLMVLALYNDLLRL